MNKIFNQMTHSVLIGFTIATVSLSIQGCSSNSDDFVEEKIKNTEMNEYLDCSENDIFSKRGMETLSEAFQRIGNKLVMENDTCYLTVHLAKDLNMSDYLFSIVKQSVKNANTQYEMYQLLKDNNKGIVIKNPFEINKQVATTRVGVESAYGNQWSTNTYTLSHTEVTIVINAMRSSNGSAATFASIVMGCLPNGGAASILIALYGYFNDGKFSSIQDEYARSGYTNGITLRESTMYSPTGLTSTSYSSSINR